MPRMPRVKTTDSIFHVMCRSISEVDLFKTDADKKKFMSILKDYQNTYKFRIYGYCLMTNHAHLIIDANGADISTIMHSVNFKYAVYFNGTHKRHGHLFQDRFKSKIIMDDSYLYALSAYIHNNVTDLAAFKNNPEKYEFSSLGVYLGLHKDPYNMVEDSFVLSLFGKNTISAREKYKKFMVNCDILLKNEDLEFDDEMTEYRSGRKTLIRNISVMDIVDYILEKMDSDKILLHTKYVRNMATVKAMVAVALRCFCNSKCSDICSFFGNITQSSVSSYCCKGTALISSNAYYRDILNGLISA